jgi:hypothetical protein
MVMKMSGHLTQSVFSRYNIQAIDDLREAARKIEEGAASAKANIPEKAASEPKQVVQ